MVLVQYTYSYCLLALYEVRCKSLQRFFSYTPDKTGRTDKLPTVCSLFRENKNWILRACLFKDLSGVFQSYPLYANFPTINGKTALQIFLFNSSMSLYRELPLIGLRFNCYKIACFFLNFTSYMHIHYVLIFLHILYSCQLFHFDLHSYSFSKQYVLTTALSYNKVDIRRVDIHYSLLMVNERYEGRRLISFKTCMSLLSLSIHISEL